MSRYFQDPKNALKRANELVSVGRGMDAVKLIQSVLKSRRHRTWTQVHEPIMLKYIEICVSLRDSAMAKDGLHQYRNIAQQQAPQSLETVIYHLLNESEKRMMEAVELMEQSKENIVANAAVENQLLIQSSRDTAFDRAKHGVMKPWVRFLWESFRTVLEILSNNQTLHGKDIFRGRGIHSPSY